MKKLTLTMLVTLTTLISTTVYAGQAPDPKPAKAPHEAAVPSAEKPVVRVYFKNLRNGQTIPQKYRVQFGVDGMIVKPAGEILAGTGHHHLVIDGNAIPAGQVVPADETHLHFGKGQTETEIELKPGKHKLVLQFADGAHLSYGPEISSVVDVVVK